MSQTIICPQCGALDPTAIELYSPQLRRQRFGLTPIYPTCKSCGQPITLQSNSNDGEVRCGGVRCGGVRCGGVRCGGVRCGGVRCGGVRCGGVRCGGVRCGGVRCGGVRCGGVRCGGVRCGEVIIINGTCGSGKSTVAEEMQQYGYIAMDGDCVRQSARYRYNDPKLQDNSPEAMAEIAWEIDCLRLFTDKIVFAQVVLPADVARYVEMFERKQMRYRLILLRPAYETALARCQTRTCHDTVTPEYWIRYFYEALSSDGWTVIDNTELTVGETVAAILAI